jgi:hypothetical protein
MYYRIQLCWNPNMESVDFDLGKLNLISFLKYPHQGFLFAEYY